MKKKIITTASVQALIIQGIVTSKFNSSPKVFNISSDDLPVFGNVNKVSNQECAWTGMGEIL